ncbi:MAG: PEGA domain-containing protein [Polyangia bacterium]
MKRHRLLFFAIVLLPTLASARPAAAQDPREDEARVEFERGESLLDSGEVEKAAEALDKAYEILPDFKYLWLIGQVQMELGNKWRALQAYERYLADGGKRIPVSRAAKAGRRIERLRSQVGSIRIDCQVEGATVFVDGSKRGTTPLSEPLPADAGMRQLKVERDGDLLHREVVRVGAGQEVSVAVDPETIVEAEGDDDGKGQRRIWTWVAFGVGGAALVSGGVLGGVVLSRSKDLKNECDDDICPESRWSDLEKTRSLATATDVLLGVGAAALVAGTVLFFVEPGSEDEQQVAVTPSVTDSGFGLSLEGRF